MKKYLLALTIICASAFSAQAEVIKNKMALGCAEKEVAKTAASEMIKYVDAINNQQNVPFSEDCEIFMEGDTVEIIEKPEGEQFVKAQRPAQIKSFWIPLDALGQETAETIEKTEKTEK